MYLELLKPDPSLDACRIYEHHWQNTPRLLTLLTADIIITNKQPNEPTFPTISYLQKTPCLKPIGKYITLLIKSLNEEQRKTLLQNKAMILAQTQNQSLPKDNIAHNIHSYIKHQSDDQYQLKLLIPIAQQRQSATHI